MKKKRLVILTISLFLISPLVISLWPISNPFTSIRNDGQDEETKINFETPKLSSGHRWILDGLEICTTAEDQVIPQIASDGEGGALLTWVDYRSYSDGIYAQKVDSHGDVQWRLNGVPVDTGGGQQYLPQICSDGAGGAIITWRNYHGGNYDIFAQRINSLGNAQWTTNGIVICNSTGYKQALQICSDGTEGAIISWRDNRNGNYDIYAQLVDSNGNTQWNDNGTAACTNMWSQDSPKLCSDGEGGGIITWLDRRDFRYDILAQRINSSGKIQWIDNGTAISNFTSYKYPPEICSNREGGAIITWSDYRNGLSDIFAQLVDLNGTTQWTANGTAVCEYSGEQYFPQICRDGMGGAIISWKDDRNSNYDVYAQKINSTGNKQWTTNGVALSTSANDKSEQQISSDGEEGAVITWTEINDIYAQRVDFNGDLLLTEDGAQICKADNAQYLPQICSIGNGSAIITWQDYRSGDGDIYAQRVFNYTGDAEVTLITPESKLYTEPMSSYYIATFGFENDEKGDDPTDWSIEEAGGTVQVKDSFSGHSKVVEMHETSDYPTELSMNFGHKARGTIEWWTSVNRDDDWYELGVFNGVSNEGIHMSFANDGYLKYHDGSVWTVIMPYSADVWYHFKVEWHSTTEWHLWINGSSQDAGMGYSFRNSPSSLDQIRFQISDVGIHQDQYMYIDAVGFSWDQDYNLGDNWNEGLLVGIKVNISLFTLDYCLDNQINVSISGNTTIPLPEDGQHSIRVFGSTFLRDFVQTEANHFIVDTKLPEIQILAPSHSDTAGEKPPFIMVSIIEANVISKWYTIGESGVNYELPHLLGLIDADAWSAVPLGPISIRVYVEDVAGNIVFKEVTINKELEIPAPLIFNITIISMFAVIGVLMVLTFREIKVPRER